jgi:hypothetical protein
MIMPADDITSDVADAPQPTKGRPGPVQTVSNNTSTLTLGDLARAQAAKALANSVCEEIAHE